MGEWRSVVVGATAVALLWSAQAAAAEPAPQAVSGPRERAQVETRYKWKLDDLFVDVAAWEKDFAGLQADLKGIVRCKAEALKSAVKLADCLDARFALEKRFHRLRVYAERTNDQDARKSDGQALQQRVSAVGTQTEAALSFFAPAILSIPERKLKSWMGHKRLAPYAHRIDDITRRRKHVLPPREEEIVARTGDLGALPESLYETLATVNIPWPEVTLSGGRKVVLTRASYTLHRAEPDRSDRIEVFRAFFQKHKDFRETFARMLAGAVSRDAFHAKVRGYQSDLAAALGASAVPVGIYHNMIDQIRAGRPLLWRYLKLRKRMLKLDKLAYHDLYVSIVPKVQMRFPFEETRKLVVAATAPLGKDYVAIMNRAWDERWMDVYPTAGKRSGAYMSGMAYDVHPYVLLNHNDDYEGLSTAAHELGHAAHSYLANKAQPFHNADYPTFTAEVASTLDEDLLRLHMLGKEKDKDRRLFLLGQYLEGWRTTVFRQALFAEFELRMHELAQAGKPLTADLLDATYLELLRTYYGEKEGVCEIDPLYASEWAYIPHFYYNFYMFQYTTSFVAASAIARRIYDGDTKARDDYLAMLAAGGSKYPAELLAMAGVDMATAAPYTTAFKSLALALDEVEKLIGQP